MFILQFLFFIFIIVLIVGLFIAVRIYLTIRHTAGKFRDFATGGFRQQAKDNYGPRQDGRYGYKITDTRSEEERHRKIFPDQVGEYVRFKEIRK